MAPPAGGRDTRPMDQLLGALVSGRYRVLRVLGAGGAGTVYAALDASSGREVALKVVELHGDDELRQRTQREARLAGRLAHDNIVALHDFIDEGERAVFVMELVRGETLEARLARGTLSARESLTVARDVLAALAAAHDAGVLHRDLKPANVMLAAGGGVAKVLDFGIARAVDSDSRITQAGLVVGSRGYIAPERLRGARETARSDLYAVGVLWFEMLAGEKPVPSARPTDGGDYDGDVRRYFRPARRVGDVSARPVPAGIDGLVADLLAPRPEGRPASARAALERLCAAERGLSLHDSDLAEAPTVFRAAVPSAAALAAFPSIPSSTGSGVFAAAPFEEAATFLWDAPAAAPAPPRAWNPDTVPTATFRLERKVAAVAPPVARPRLARPDPAATVLPEPDEPSLPTLPLRRRPVRAPQRKPPRVSARARLTTALAMATSAVFLTALLAMTSTSVRLALWHTVISASAAIATIHDARPPS